MNTPRYRHDHIAEMLARRPELSPLAPEIRLAAEMLLKGFRRGGNVLIAGNGGSAADADHWAGELIKGFESRRPLTHEQRAGLRPELADKLQQAVPCIPLTASRRMTAKSKFSKSGDEPQARFSVHYSCAPLFHEIAQRRAFTSNTGIH